MRVRKAFDNPVALGRPVIRLAGGDGLSKELHDGKRQDIRQIARGSCDLVLSGCRFHRQLSTTTVAPLFTFSLPDSLSLGVWKKARLSFATVLTSTERSRYLLPRSHEVSGKNRQA